MSWERYEYEEFAICKCGKGIVIRRMYREDDDWNKTREGYISEEINCTECSCTYHIEHHIRHCFCMPWDGDGISDRIFLVPNDVTIPDVKTERSFSFNEIDKDIVASVSISDIKAAISDMKDNKYTTRLKVNSSKKIVALYQKQCKKKSLNLIIPLLEGIVQNYDRYEWTVDTIEEYRKKERETIAENERKIKEAISVSFELKFTRGKV